MRLVFPFVGSARSFRHGTHPAEHKDATHALRIEQMPFVERYVLPLSQHLGAPSKAIVEPGQRVQRGQRIADPGGFVSVALHAPVRGQVESIERCVMPNGGMQPAIVIRADAYASQQLPERGSEGPPRPVDAGDADAVIAAVQGGGLVGLGGAAFPAHVKLKVPEGKRAEVVLLNGCECEPFLTCDHRVMVEQGEAVLGGLRHMMRILDAPRGCVGIEQNKPDAIETLQRLTADDPRIEIVAVETKYPEGAEKMLIEAVLGRQVPVGKLPIDLGVVVNNVGTSAALAELLDHGHPLIDRVVTVTGPGVRRPANLRVPIGTPLSALIEHCGGLSPRTRKVVLGGPMMGQALASLDAPVLKGVSGVLALEDDLGDAPEEPCIRCGRCLEACAMFLNPSRLALAARLERTDDLRALHANACFECASCSYVCPSYIPLVQLIRMGKTLLRKETKR